MHVYVVYYIDISMIVVIYICAHTHRYIYIYYYAAQVIFFSAASRSAPPPPLHPPPKVMMLSAPPMIYQRLIICMRHCLAAPDDLGHSLTHRTVRSSSSAAGGSQTWAPD